MADREYVVVVVCKAAKSYLVRAKSKAEARRKWEAGEIDDDAGLEITFEGLERIDHIELATASVSGAAGKDRNP